jgi:hypothetical protein
MADKELEKKKRNVKWALDSDSKQREREKEALRFRTDQWDADAKRARSGEDGSQTKRPMLSIPKFLQPLNLVRNQFANAHLGVVVHPLNERSNKENAEVRQDIIRRIERDSNSEYMEFWAYDRAVQAGRGAYRVVAEYDQDTEDPYDQKLLIKRIYDQSLAVFDPAAQEPDKSDGRFAALLAWVPYDDMQSRFPAAKYDYEGEAEFEELRVAEPDWVTGVDDKRAVLVCEYFYKHEDKSKARKRVMLKSKASAYADELPEGAEIDDTREAREIGRTIVKICTFSAAEVLEEGEWPGKYIPLIPTIADELQPVDGERRYQGLIEPAMDACRGYNYTVSQAIETLALSPKATVVGYEGQFEGHETKWNSRTTRNWAYMEIKPTTIDGKPAPFPTLMQPDTSGVQMATMMAQQMDGDIQAATGLPDPSLGNLSSRDRSGKAIQALQQQAYEGSSHYMRNMAQISIRLRGLILLDAMPYIYDRPGRVMQVIDAEMRPRPIMLGKPFAIDKQSGMPVEAQEGQPGVKSYDLSSSNGYGITVTVGKAYASRQQQGADQLTEMLTAKPELMQVIGDIWAGFLDVPGAEQLRKRLLKMIEKANPGITQAEDEAPTPEQMEAAMQAKDQQMLDMKQMLQQATQALETEMAKQKATLEKAQMETQSRELQTAQTNQMKLMIEKLGNQNEVLIQGMRDLDAQRDREHEAKLKAVDLAVSTVDSAEERRLNADESERGRAHEADEADRTRRHGSDEAQRATDQADGAGE